MPIRDAATVGPDEVGFRERTKLVLASSLNSNLETWPTWWRPIARFCRNPLLQARARDANEIVLYRYVSRSEPPVANGTGWPEPKIPDSGLGCP